MDTIQITFEVATGKKQEVIDDLCSAWGYNAATDGTKPAFLKKQLALHLKNAIRVYRIASLSTTNTTTVATAVDALNIS